MPGRRQLTVWPAYSRCCRFSLHSSRGIFHGVRRSLGRCSLAREHSDNDPSHHTDETMNRAASIAATCACLIWSGCSYAIRPPVVEAGVGFSEGRSNEIKKGDTDARVRELLGTPYETNDDPQRWRYYMRVRGVEERRLFGFVPVKDAT